MNNSYAQVLYDTVSDKDNCAYNLELMRSVIDSQILNFFTAQVISKEEKKALLDDLNIGFDAVINFLKVLIDDNMMKYFDKIVNDYRDIYLNANNILIVKVTIAHQLDNEMYDNIINQLNNELGKHVVLQTTIDPTIVGGIIIHYEDKVVDNTIKTKLQQLEKAIRREVL